MKNLTKNKGRRAFIKKMSILGSASVCSTSFANTYFESGSGISNDFNDYLTLESENQLLKPLDTLKIKTSKNGFLKVYDGNSNLYIDDEIKGFKEFKIGGGLGNHLIILSDKKEKLLDFVQIQVDCKTGIECSNKRYEELFDLLYWIIIQHFRPEKFGDEVYQFGVGWFQDNVHLLKSLKYFRGNQQDFFDLFTLGQYESGMIPDFVRKSNAQLNYYIQRFSEKYINHDKNKSGFFVKVPVENMSEFHYLEGLYYIWKATGDDEWMKGKLDKALKAVDYELTSRTTWSDKYKLIKRSYTIDIWDFLPDKEADRLWGDIMANDPDKSKYGILYADNIGVAVGCDYLSEMLDYAGRQTDAQRIKKIGDDLRKRTYELCWNGDFFTHRIPEDPNEDFDFGNTDIASQVTLSNSYALNKGLDHKKCVKIIKTYQRIQKEMPASSPGEWYMCYPPYEKGWHMDKWEYMNGGVSPIVAGELAHGAFEHGFEKYGVDILERVHNLTKSFGNDLKCIYRGAMPEVPKREFTILDIKQNANADLVSNNNSEVPGWIDVEGDDLINLETGVKELEHVKFNILEPENNNRKACIALSNDKGYINKTTVPVNKKAESIYFLHAMHDPYFTISHSAVPKGRYYAGNFKFIYADGSAHTQHITNDQVGFYHFPTSLKDYEWPRHNSSYYYKVAWRGDNKKYNDVGLYITGFDNPNPGKEIVSIELEGAGSNTKWMILGMTLTDKPVFLMPDKISFGAPDNWAAAAVMYAIIEGLAGVKDTGVAFNKVTISPRWEAANVNEAFSIIKYEDSEGYVAYQYIYANDVINLTFTGTSGNTELKILMPGNKNVRRVAINNEEIEYKVEEIEQSKYIVTNVSGIDVKNLKVQFS